MPLCQKQRVFAQANQSIPPQNTLAIPPKLPKKTPSQVVHFEVITGGAL
jgi:hypothetical protein